ncbi:MAG: PhzF family phenazine biosynthesis protein [Actinomycetes bacterium]
MTRLDFEVVDVFTDTAYRGNPLAVVNGAEALSTEQMQAIAREFNLSETTFPLSPTPEQAARDVDYHLRIFTPASELPFAGHPSVGTAWLMAARGRVGAGRVVQACGAGDLPLLVSEKAGPVTLTGGAPTLGDLLDGAAVAAGVGLRPEDLTGTPVQQAGTGVQFCFLHVHPEAVARARPVALDTYGAVGVYVVGWPDAPDTEHVRARMFATDIGVMEDPATGSAALGLAVHAVAHGLLPADGSSRFDVVQGVEVGRRSMLRVAVDAEGGRAVEARVSGDVVAVSSGSIEAPA